ncbi:uncharacterized protein VTP21DRAFT_9326 [Calcarisporiella thermophila]|uniref:uncharacterized protein n=1 Tax=Calcarisporiella thermophila TaxID=911321 RepID=UPI003744010C
MKTPTLVILTVLYAARVQALLESRCVPANHHPEQHQQNNIRDATIASSAVVKASTVQGSACAQFSRISPQNVSGPNRYHSNPQVPSVYSKRAEESSKEYRPAILKGEKGAQNPRDSKLQKRDISSVQGQERMKSLQYTLRNSRQVVSENIKEISKTEPPMSPRHKNIEKYTIKRNRIGTRGNSRTKTRKSRSINKTKRDKLQKRQRCKRSGRLKMAGKKGGAQDQNGKPIAGAKKNV